ncbi:PTS sugar transporter subunit IIA [Tannockella kyphosi]|uniref:PTS sugar transporter subunit IIA n=1 Tax=Tannockella kyphosi TaxID=2899121 RepID=UPI0020111748|nr:hypothetical protein [Tannockella kyphosi]
MKKNVVLVSHGELCKGMAHSLKMIIGENESLLSLSMMPGEHDSVVSDQIEKMATDNPNVQYVVVSDLYGGSVGNGCIPLLELPNVKLVSGMNMGLVIELLFAPAPMSDDQINEKINLCKEGIVQISKIETNDQVDDEDFF